MGDNKVAHLFYLVIFFHTLSAINQSTFGSVCSVLEIWVEVRLKSFAIIYKLTHSNMHHLSFMGTLSNCELL